MKVVLLRPRPSIVEATQVDEFNLADVAIWCNGVVLPGRGVGVYTATGDFACATFGNWMIKGQYNNFYPEPDGAVFSRYESVLPLVSE